MSENHKSLKDTISWYLTSHEADEKVRPCPGEEILCDYLGDRLRPEVREDVEKHLIRCEACVETLLAASMVLEDPYVPAASDVPVQVEKRVLKAIPSQSASLADRLWKQVKLKGFGFLETLSDLFPFSRQEFVYVRGRKQVISENLVLLEKVFKDIKLEIEIEKTGDGSSEIKIKGSHPGTGAPLNGIRINLCDGDRELASFVTANGGALFEKIAFGLYRLIVWDNRKKLGEVLLKIKE